MDKFKRGLKVFVTLCTSLTPMMLVAPQSTLLKIFQRLGISNKLPNASRFLENHFGSTHGKNRVSHEFIGCGKSIGIAQSSSFAGVLGEGPCTVDRPRLSNELHDWVPDEKKGASHRSSTVLYYLTNAKPFTNSGYTERTQHMLEALHTAGVSVKAVTRLGYPAIVGILRFPVTYNVKSVEYSTLVPSYMPIMRKKREQKAVELLSRTVVKENPRILHTTTDYINAVVVSNVARQFGLPWIYEVRGEPHNTWLSKQPPDFVEAAKRSNFYRNSAQQEINAAMSADRVICLSEVSKARLRNSGVPAAKLVVIPNAVDENLIGRQYSKLALREKHKIANRITVGTVSSLVNYEGIDDLLRALTLLEDVNCLIVGDGESREKLQTLAVELGVSERVTFVGKKPSPNIWEWYAVMDVFVMPRKDAEVSRSVTPIKGMIAQALGIPTVASDLPALREVTGGNAEYCEAGNPISIASSIRTLIAEPESIRQHRQVSSIQFAASRTWRSNAEQLRKVYDELAAR